jgi:hypothetical protein
VTVFTQYPNLKSKETFQKASSFWFVPEIY